MIDATTLVPTWGYRPDGSAQIFELEAGAALPNGWHPTPDCIEDRSLATAEALSEAAARSAKFVQSRPAAARTDAAAPAAPPAMSEENARLLTENTGLIADLAAVRARLATIETEKAQALKQVAALVTELGEARVAARDNSSTEAEPAADASPSVQSGQPARTRAEAREAVLVLLGEDLTDREIARRVGVSPSTVSAVRKSAS